VVQLFDLDHRAVLRSYGGPFAVAYIATVVCYGYFFFSLGFTNHTTNVWVYSYPSFKTTLEGRWFADILIRLTGGSGVPPFQMAVAAAIQIVNAFVFCAIFRQSNRVVIYMAALAIALHPAFLDYYSFTVDHISFVTGDLLALLGVLAMQRGRTFVMRWILPVVCFVLSIATYQPKIALIGFLLVARCFWAGDEAYRDDVRRLAQSAVVFVLSAVIYYISIRLTIRVVSTDYNSARQHINSIPQIVSQVLFSYKQVISYFTSRVDYLPPMLKWMPGLLIVLGLGGLLVSRWRAGILPFALGVLLILAIPPVLQLSFVINSEAYSNSGRILSVHGYFLCFAFIAALAPATLRGIPLLLQGALIYFFAIVATQESNQASVKNVFDSGQVNRIISRIETTVPDVGSKVHPLVVIDQFSFQPARRLRAYPNTLYGSQVRTTTFVNYRQVEIANFFIGKEALRSPTTAEVAAAVRSACGRKPWPATESVFADGDTIVVLLGNCHGPTTWTE